MVCTGLFTDIEGILLWQKRKAKACGIELHSASAGDADVSIVLSRTGGELDIGHLQQFYFCSSTLITVRILPKWLEKP